MFSGSALVFRILSFLLFSCCISNALALQRVYVGFYETYQDADSAARAYDSDNCSGGSISAGTNTYSWKNRTCWHEELDDHLQVSAAFYLNEQCPPGTEVGANGECVSDNEKERGKPNSKCTGNPIAITTGNKFQQETDYASYRNPLLNYSRYYSSLSATWYFSYSRRISMGTVASNKTTGETYAYQVNLRDDDGKVARFIYPNSNTNFFEGRWESDGDTQGELFREADQWVFKRSSGTVETYNLAGRLTSIYQVGSHHHLAFEYLGQTTTITDQFGYQLQITVDPMGRPTTVVTPETITIDYTYQDDLLDTVSASDGFYRKYHYENTGFPGHLTGITDERGIRYATWGYDSAGRGDYSAHGELDDNGKRKEESLLDFVADNATKVTNAFGKETTYYFEKIWGVKKVTHVEGHPSTSCLGADAYYSYDSNGYKDKVTDRKGNVTDYDYNALGLPELITEGLRWVDPELRETLMETANKRVTDITWLLDTRQKEVVSTDTLKTEYEYYPNNRLKKITQTDLTDYTNSLGSTEGSTRSWEYAYTYFNGENIPVDVLVKTMTIDGPLPGTADTTTREWDIEGNLLRVTNALNHETLFSDFNGRGLPRTITDSNNVITRVDYHPRGWVDKVTLEAPGSDRSNDAVTDYIWYPNGTLEQIILPDGSYLHYDYNDARHLVEIRNNLDETMTFTPNAMGEWVVADTKDGSANIKRHQQRAFDELGRLMDVFGNDNQHTHFGYDLNNNLNALEEYGEDRTLTTALNYDALDRLENSIKPIQRLVNGSTVPAEVKTAYTYDSNDRLNSVTDPEDKVTTYWNNGFGERIRKISPDTQTTDYWYDPQGNMTDKLDARDAPVKYHYDVLGRLKHIEYLGNSAEDVHYYYDEVTTENPYAKGRLTQVTDPSGSTTFIYDHRGNIVKQLQVIDTQSNITEYRYNLADNLTGIIYPSGRIVTYQRNDLLGRISAVTTKNKANASEKILASAVDYLPFGPITQLTYGNGLVREVPYDLDYRVDQITVGNLLQLDLGYDWFDNINVISDLLDTNNSQQFTYDDLQQLQDAYGHYRNNVDHIHYEYDLIGNRTLLQRNSNNTLLSEESYAYHPDTHRLKEIARTDSGGLKTRSFTYDDAGNIDTETTYGGDDRQFTHAQNNRLIKVEENISTLGEYTHNALGQRAVKTASGATTLFHYGLQSQLLSESRSDGFSHRDYVYLHGQMIAVIDNQPSEYIQAEETIETTPLLSSDDYHESHYGTADVTSLPNGDAVSVWRAYNASTDTYQYYTRTYDADGGGWQTSQLAFEDQFDYVFYLDIKANERGDLLISFLPPGSKTYLAYYKSYNGTWSSGITIAATSNGYLSKVLATLDDTGDATFSWVKNSGYGYLNYLNMRRYVPSTGLGTAHTLVADDGYFTIGKPGEEELILAGTDVWQWIGSQAGGGHGDSLYILHYAASSDTFEVFKSYSAPSIDRYRTSVSIDESGNILVLYTTLDTNGDPTVTTDYYQSGVGWTALPTSDALFSPAYPDGSLVTSTFFPSVMLHNGKGILSFQARDPDDDRESAFISFFDGSSWSTAEEVADGRINVSYTDDGRVQFTYTEKAYTGDVCVQYASWGCRSYEALYFSDLYLVQYDSVTGWSDPLLVASKVPALSYVVESAGTESQVMWWGMDTELSSIRLTSSSQLASSQLYTVLTDQLGTPVVISDRQTVPAVVWEGHRDPFGDTVVTINQIGFEVRFPGQYFDGETGLHYNYYRDYDPSIGRYVQSDPIGLAGGLNTYAYVEQNPLNRIDPRGLRPMNSPGPNGKPGPRGGSDECGCLAKAFLGIDDAVVGGGMAAAAGATGPFAKKPRGGIAGGGRAGSRTSLVSKMIHKKNRGSGKTAASRAARNASRKIFTRAIPGAGTALLIYDALQYEKCIEECKECQK